MPSHCDAVHCIELHCITLHHLTLQAYTHIVQIPVHTYLHIYIYIFTYLHIYIYTYIFIHTYIYIYTYIYKYIYTRMSMHMLNTNFIYPIIAVPTLPWMLGCWICHRRIQILAELLRTWWTRALEGADDGRLKVTDGGIRVLKGVIHRQT